MLQRIVKVGNSLAVTIPTKFAKTLGVKKGDEIKVEKKVDKNQLIIQFNGVTQMEIK